MKTFLQILQIRGDISVSFLKIRKLKLSKFLLLSLPWTTKVYWEKTRNYKNSDIPWRCVQLDKLFLKSDYQQYFKFSSVLENQVNLCYQGKMHFLIMLDTFLNSKMGSIHSRTFSRVTIKRACIQVMMEINKKRLRFC